MKKNAIIKDCYSIEPTGLQEDSYRCSLFAFEHLRKMFTTSYTEVSKYIHVSEEYVNSQSLWSASASANYNVGDLSNKLIATTTEDAVALQQKMLNYLTDIALDLVFYLNPELLALQDLSEAEKGVALTTLLESYLFPLCLKVDIKDPAGLAERIAKEMVYEIEINQAGTTAASTTAKAGLLKKLEASTRVSSAEVSDSMLPLGLS